MKNLTYLFTSILFGILAISITIILPLADSLAENTVVVGTTGDFSANLEAAINEITLLGGGTILIPEGEFENTKILKFASGISFIGEGIDKTIIITNHMVLSTMEKFIGKLGDGLTRFSGITFKNENIETKGGNALQMYHVVRFRIDHCKFIGRYGDGAIVLENSFGMFDHCEINTMKTCQGIAIANTQEEWDENIKDDLGKEKAVYIEDCHFINCNPVLRAGPKTRYVLRHCTITDCQTHIKIYGMAATDWLKYELHGTYYAEIYNNMVKEEIMPGPVPKLCADPAVKIGGAGGVVFNNIFENFKIGILLQIDYLDLKSSTDPSYPPYPSYPALNNIHDLWIWDNTYKNCNHEIMINDNGSEDFLKEDRDYFLRPPSQELDELTYIPYIYPHPMITGVYEDTIAPGDIDDLSLISPDAVLTWTAPGDDGDIYKAFKYDLRYSTEPITESNWDSAINLNGAPIPSEPGTIETMRISQIGKGTYYFAIKTLDEKGNSSGLSNITMGNIEFYDITEPSSISEVRDGTGQDIDVIASLTELSANWDTANDPESDIKRYWYAIGTIAGGTDVQDWTDNGKATSVTIEGLSLSTGKWYYFSVKAENRAGLESKTTTSDGVFINIGIVGDNVVFSLIIEEPNRLAMPYIMPEDGIIEGISIYHEGGGSGNLILGIYDGDTLPDSRIAVTPSTLVTSSAGWQTINIISPVYIPKGQKIWLAWVFENNPGMRRQDGSPGRASSSEIWEGGMPEEFGTSTTADYIYSIYAIYTTDQTVNGDEKNPDPDSNNSLDEDKPAVRAIDCFINTLGSFKQTRGIISVVLQLQ